MSRMMIIKQDTTGALVGSMGSVSIPAGTYPIIRGNEWFKNDSFFIISNVPHENPEHAKNGHTTTAFVAINTPDRTGIFEVIGE